MKSQNIRTYKKDGKTFMWNRIGFIDEIDRITKAKDAAGKRIGPTQIALFEQIAYQCDITPEAIRHWRAGNNSPVKLEYIEVCANVLGIDIMSLLTPIEEKKEDTKLTDIEVALIQKVYGECISSMYYLSDCNGTYVKRNPEESHSWSDRCENYYKKLDTIHMVIDSSLFISESVRYRLHRITNDMGDHDIFLGMSERWESLNTIRISEHTYIDRIASIYEMNIYQNSTDRGGEIDEWDLYYVEDEKALAEKLGYRYTEIPEAYLQDDELKVPLDDEGKPKSILDVCRIEDLTDFEIGGYILFRDMMTRFIKMVFAHDFPELDLPEFRIDGESEKERFLKNINANNVDNRNQEETDVASANNDNQEDTNNV